MKKIKLGMGTAQLGMNYGAYNTAGKASIQMASDMILAFAEKGGTILDTAVAYGESEEVIGQCLDEINHKFEVITKIPAASKDFSVIDTMVRQSMIKLRVDFIDGVMFHSAADLLDVNGRENYRALKNLKDDGIVKKIGVSVYNGEQAREILSKYEIDLIQLPINLMDQRLISGGELELLKEKNVEIHARSVFLQGVLLNSPKLGIPEFLMPYQSDLLDYWNKVLDTQFTPLEMALLFIQSVKQLDAAIIGFDTPNHVREIASVWKRLSEESSIDFSRFASSNTGLLDPSGWR